MIWQNQLHLSMIDYAYALTNILIKRTCSEAYHSHKALVVVKSSIFSQKQKQSLFNSIFLREWMVLFVDETELNLRSLGDNIKKNYL